jgi:hypothetical protein
VKHGVQGAGSCRGLVGCRLAGPGGLRRWELLLDWLLPKLAHRRDQLARCHRLDWLLVESFPKFVEMVEEATDSEALVVAGLAATVADEDHCPWSSVTRRSNGLIVSSRKRSAALTSSASE